MAILVMDGFDQYTTAGNPGDIVSARNMWHCYNRPITAGIGTSSTTPYGRGRSVWYEDYSWIQAYLPTLQTGTIITGFHYLTDGIGVAETLGWMNENVSHEYFLGLENTGALSLYGGARATLITSSTDTDLTYTISQNVWYWIEIKSYLHDTAGTFELRVNGDVWINESNIDTKQATTTGTGIQSLRFSTSDNEYNYLDNFYVANTSTANNAQVYDFQGPCEIMTLMPSSDTATVDWGRSAGTTNSENVDEATANMSDYVYTDTSTNTDTYNYADLPTGTWSIKAVNPIPRIQQMEPGFVDLTMAAGSQSATGIRVDPAGNNWYTDGAIWETSNGTNAWTTSDINSMTVSYEYE